MASNFSRVCKLTSQLQSCATRSEEHTSELQSHVNLVCRLLLEKKIWSFLPKTRKASKCSDLHGMSVRPSFSSYQAIAPFFFLNNTATPEIYPLSLRAPLAI